MIKHSSHLQNFEMFLVLRTIRDMRIEFRLRLALVRLSFFLRLRLHTPKEDVNMIYMCHVTCRKTSAGLSTFICTHVFVIFQKKIDLRGRTWSTRPNCGCRKSKMNRNKFELLLGLVVTMWRAAARSFAAARPVKCDVHMRMRCMQRLSHSQVISQVS